ncbi:MAG: hypothetical protein JXA14_00790, partial [Anaerolineae bacterium]|nr:hypothetical protein [Anaerolineae bacterium]
LMKPTDVWKCRRDAEQTADSLLSLEEPWRGRFLIYIAKAAIAGQWDGHLPDREEVMFWLHNDPYLRQHIGRLLWIWIGQELPKEARQRFDSR